MNKITKEVLRNCVPAMICMVISGLNTIIDGLFIGKNIGEDGLAAINIAWPVPAFIVSSGIGIGVGCGICYVSALGKKCEKKAKEFIKNAFVFLACMGVLYGMIFEIMAPYIIEWLGAKENVYNIALTYTRIISAAAIIQIFGAGLVPIVRNINMPIEAMEATISGVCSNIIFNTIFVVILKMGIKGAALGTVLSQVVTSIIAVLSIMKSGVLRKQAKTKEKAVHKKQKELRKLTTLKIRLQHMRSIFLAGLASFGVSLLPTWVLVFTNYQCLAYGGSKTVACYAAISYLIFPAQSMLTGIADGAQPLFSMCAAKENKGEKEKLIKNIVVKFEIITSSVIIILLAFFAPAFHKVFSLRTENYIPFIQGLRITSISLLFYGLNRLSITIMNGKRKYRQAAVIIYMEAIFYTPIMLFLLPKYCGIFGIWMESVVVAVMTEIICLVVSD